MELSFIKRGILTIFTFYGPSMCFFIRLILAVLVICTLSCNVIPVSLAVSPSFVRQEIQDGSHDLLAINDNAQNITKLDYLDVNESIFNSWDIDRISYFSDGRFLNATIWLHDTLNNDLLSKVPGVNFGMMIDVNPNLAVGIGGANYHKEVFYPAPPGTHNTTENYWTEDTDETLSDGPRRHLNASEHNYNYNQLFQKGARYIPLSLDLSNLVFPEQYKVMFYVSFADDHGNIILDFTSWMDIPPPKFNLSASSGSIVEIRSGETKSIGLVLKSSFGSLPPKVISFTTVENQTGVKVIPPHERFDESTNILKPASFNIAISGDTLPGEYIIPIKANISSGPTIPTQFTAAKNYTSGIPPVSSHTAVAGLTIRVSEPLTFTQWFKEGWDTYGSFISLVGGGFTAGLATLVFDRLKNKKKRLPLDS